MEECGSAPGLPGPRNQPAMPKGLTHGSLSRVINIEDLRRLARRRLPQVVFDYVDGGAEGEVTLREIAGFLTTSYFDPGRQWRFRIVNSALECLA